jgi:GTP-dependent phosphoenolpyruvate carboxykinase
VAAETVTTDDGRDLYIAASIWPVAGRKDLAFHPSADAGWRFLATRETLMVLDTQWQRVEKDTNGRTVHCIAGTIVYIQEYK